MKAVVKIELGYDLKAESGYIEVLVLDRVVTLGMDLIEVIEGDEIVGYERGVMRKVAIESDGSKHVFKTVIDDTDRIGLWQGVLAHRFKEMVIGLADSGQVDASWKKRVKTWSMDRLDEEFEVRELVRV